MFFADTQVSKSIETFIDPHKSLGPLTETSWISNLKKFPRKLRLQGFKGQAFAKAILILAAATNKTNGF